MDQKQNFKLVEKIATWFMLLILVFQVITSGLFGVIAQAESSVGDLLLINEQGTPINNLTLEKGEVKVIGVKTTNKEDSSVQVNLGGLHLKQDQTNEKNAGNPVSIAYSEEASNVIASWQTTPTVTQDKSVDEQAATENNQINPILEDPVTQFVNNQAWLVVEGTEAGTYQVQARSSRSTGIGMSDPLVVTVKEKVVESSDEVTEELKENKATKEGKKVERSKASLRRNTKAVSSVTSQVWDLNTSDWGTANEITDFRQYNYGIKYNIQLTLDNEEAKNEIAIDPSLVNHTNNVPWAIISEDSVSGSNPAGSPADVVFEFGTIILEPNGAGNYQLSFVVKFSEDINAFKGLDVEGTFNEFTLTLDSENQTQEVKTKAVFPQPYYLIFTDSKNPTSPIIQKKIQFKLIRKSDGSIQTYTTEGDTGNPDRSFGAWLNIIEGDYDIKVEKIEDDMYLPKTDKVEGSINKFVPNWTGSLKGINLVRIEPAINTKISFDKENDNYYSDVVKSTQEISKDTEKNGTDPIRFIFASENTGTNMLPKNEVKIYRVSNGSEVDVVRVPWNQVWKPVKDISGADTYRLSYEYQLSSPLLDDEKIFMETDWQLLEKDPEKALVTSNYQLSITIQGIDKNDVGSNRDPIVATTNAYARTATESLAKKEVLKNGKDINDQTLVVGDTITYRMTLQALSDEETAQLKVGQWFEDQLPQGISWDPNDLFVTMTTASAGKQTIRKSNYSLNSSGLLRIDMNKITFSPNNLLYISKDKPEASKLIFEITGKVTNAASGVLENQATFNTQRRTDDFKVDSWEQDAPTKTNKVSNTVKPEVKLEKHVYAEDPRTTADQEDAKVLYADKSFFYSIDANLTPESGAMYNGVIEDDIPDKLELQGNYALLINGTEVALPQEAIEVADQKVKFDFSKVPELSPMLNTQKVTLIIEVKADASLVNTGIDTVNKASIKGTDKQGVSPTKAESQVGVRFVYPPGDLSIEKSVGKTVNNEFAPLKDKSPVKVGDTITYQLIVKNPAAVGTIVRAVHAKDNVPKGLEIVPDSINVKVSKGDQEESNKGTNLGNGQSIDVLIGDLMGGEQAEVTFDVIVTKEASGELKNIASASGKIDEVPNGPDINKDTEKNPSTELGIKPNPALTKTVSQKKAYKGQKLTYTIVATNENGAPIIKGKISDSLPGEVKYVSGTTVVDKVAIDDTLFGWANDKRSFEYSELTIDAEKTITITFEVEVTTDEVKADILNTAKFNGEYQVNTEKTEAIEESSASADFETVRQNGELAIKKEVSQNSVDRHDKVVKVGDIIEYKLIVENTTKDPSIIHNVKVTDTIPVGLVYQDNTLKVNGKEPAEGSKVEKNSLLVIIGDITEETKPIEITFNVKVTKEALAVTKNEAMASGETLKDPTDLDSTKLTQETDSNEVIIHKQPDPIIKKEILDPSDAKVFNGDEITYQISVANGTLENKETLGGLHNAKVTDELDSNLEYVDESTTVGGIKISDTGVWTNNKNFTYTFNEVIPAGESRTITFRVKVSEKAKGKINNSATIIGLDQDKNELPKVDHNVDVAVYPKPGKLEIEKLVFNKENTEIENGIVAKDSIVTYQLAIKNTVTGTSEVLNATIEDKIPAGLEYQKDSLRVVEKPATVTVKELTVSNSPDTVKAVVEKLNGEEKVIIEFKAKATAQSGSVITNQGSAKGQVTQTPGGELTNLDPVEDTVVIYKAPDPKITKKVIEPTSKEVIKGSQVTYELVITNGDKNTGELLNGQVTDVLPEGLKYVSGTTKINGQKATPEEENSWAEDNKTFKYNLPSPYLGGTETKITFTVEITKGDKSEDIGKPITNEASLTGQDKEKTSYTPDNGKDVVTPIRKDGKLAIKKSVIKDNENIHDKVVSVNDIIEYKLVVENTEKLPSEVNNVIVTDNIPDGLEYQNGTLVIEGADSSAKGQVTGNVLTAELNTLTEGQIVTISFKVKVTEKSKGVINNIALVSGKVKPIDGSSSVDVKSDDDVTVNRTPDPKIKKSIVTPTNNIVTKGDQIKYRLVVTNGDKNTGVLKNGTVTDTLVSGLKHVANTTTMNGQSVDESNWISETLTVDLPASYEGGSDPITIEFIVVVETNELGTISNTAEVSGQDITDTGNYSDTGKVDIKVVPKAGELNLKKTVTKDDKDVHDKIIRVGDIITYTMVVENPVTDPSQVKDVILKDLIPEGLEYQPTTLKVNGMLKPDSHITGQTLTINLGVIKEKAKVTVTFDVKVTAAAKGKITNIATVSGTVTPPGQEDTTLPNLTEKVENSKIPEPKIQKTVIDGSNNEINAPKVIKGQEVIYQLVVTNGTETTGILYDGVVKDTLESSLEYVAGTTKVNGKKVTDEVAGWSGNNLNYKLPKEFIGGEKLVITFTVKVTSSELGLITNTGDITGKDSEKSPDTDYNHSDPVDIEVIRGTGDPKISKEVWSEDESQDLNNQVVKAGTTIQYNLIVENKNQEPSEVRNTTVTDIIPAGLTYVQGTLTLENTLVGDENIVGQQLTLDVGTLIEGQKKVISFKVVVTDAAKGISKNIAYVTGKTTDKTGSDKELPKTPSNPVNIHKPADPEIKKSIVGAREVTIGSDIVYRLEVSNGTSENGELLEGVVSDELPEGLVYKARTTKVDKKLVNDEQVWKDNTLNYHLSSTFKGGEVTVIEFTATVNKLGSINNTASVRGTDFSKSSYDENGVVSVTAVAKPDPSIEKSVKELNANEFAAESDKIEVKANDHLIYRLVVKNGTVDSGTLFNAKVEDRLPAGLTYVANSTTINGATTLSDAEHWKNNVFTYVQPIMAPGEVLDIQFEVKVNETMSDQQIKNTATLTGKDLGTVEYNGQSDVSVLVKVDPPIEDPFEDPLTTTIERSLPNTSTKSKSDARSYPRTGEMEDQISWLGYVLIVNLAVFSLFKRKEKKDKML
ncbi:isopeptide-forming domain-containing fimbrial protein [Enterococcus quebecensis]|uniref:Gram-positive cocci surface proteins LPxTG domain-containing protein n=1 Tax=Enterococcus quebecensis TaxID=903983 RepID=A0A1E5GQ12_9ENTE|nr:isopeptide-forming domain-containing fimbrial protein [Enterococcus quebecensis]OEG14787.1 hypothetical protein BCR23_11875 [Enterococcus quebecensis]